MPKFIKEYDDGHILNRLYIYWDITTKCNFKCDYCYARNKYLPINQWNLTDTFNRQKLVIESLRLSKYPIYLGFHGGEPTLHPRFTELANLCLTKCLTHELSQLYVVTNGSTNKFSEYASEFVDFKSKLRFLLSFHPTQCKNPDKFLNNLAILADAGYKTKVNVLLYPDSKYWQICKYVYQESEKYTKVHPHFIYDCIGDDEVLRCYTPEFYQYFDFIDRSKCFYTFEDSNGNKYNISDYQLFKDGLNCFKGWKCWNNNYEIIWNGILKKICTDDEVNLTKNPLYFKRLEIKPMICTFDHCNSDGVLKCYKEF